MNWFCLKQKSTSVLVKELLQERETQLNQLLNQNLSKDLQNHGLMAYVKQAQDVHSVFYSNYLSLIQNYASNLSAYLLNPLTLHSSPCLSQQMRFLSNLSLT